MSTNWQQFNWGEPTITFAENNLSGWIAQPANTWSNLAFLAISIFIGFQIRNRKLSNVLYGFPMVITLIGLSSFFYHASATFVGQFFDFGSIYLLGSYLIFLVLYKRNKFSSKYLIFCITFVTILLLYLLWVLPILRIWIFAIGLVVYLYLEFTQPINLKRNIDYKPLIQALILFLVSLGIWLLDILYIWDFDTTSHIINGHAVWHILNSLVLYFIYRFYTTQLDKDDNNTL